MAKTVKVEIYSRKKSEKLLQENSFEYATVISFYKLYGQSVFDDRYIFEKMVYYSVLNALDKAKL